MMKRTAKIFLTLLFCLLALTWRQPFSFPLFHIRFQSGSVVAAHAQPNSHSNPLQSLTDAAVYWKFESSAGTDSTGHGNTLTSVGSPSYSSGILGNALYAVQNGATRAYATAATSSSFTPGTSSPFSINFWFYSPVANTSGAQVVFVDRGTFTSNDAFLIYLGTSHVLQITWAQDGTHGSSFTPTIAFNANTWYMLTLVVTPGTTTGSYTLYLNGSSVSSTSNTLIYGTAQSFTTFVGARGDGSTFPAGGTVRIDSFGFWARAITTTEISKLYNSGVGADPF